VHVRLRTTARLIVASSLARDLAERRFAQLVQLDLGDLVEESA